MRIWYGSGYWEDPRLIKGASGFHAVVGAAGDLVIALWAKTGSTPGKIAMAAQISDARTGRRPSTGQLIGRYFAYFVSAIPLGLGFLWSAFDSKKQGNDKLSGTVVVRRKARSTEPVQFQ